MVHDYPADEIFPRVGGEEGGGPGPHALSPRALEALILAAA